MAWAIVIGVIVLSLIAIGAALLHRRRHREWRQLARELKLRFSPHGPRIDGSLRGRKVVVRTSSESSDTAAGVEVVEIQVAVHKVPVGMYVESAPGPIGELKSYLEGTAAVGDPSFDEHAVLKTDGKAHAEQIQQYWELGRRRVFLQLASELEADRLTLGDGKLVAQMREVVSNRGHISRLLGTMLDAAAGLDG